MGDKNAIGRITSASIQLRTGHGILKAAYIATAGDRIFEIIDGTLDGDETILSIDAGSATQAPFLAPYLNHPMADGIRVQVVSGTTGELIVVYE